MEFDTALLVRSDGVKSYNYLIAASAVWLSSFSMGTCYGYSAPAKSSMLAMDEFPISEQQFQWLASILMFGGLVGALTGGVLSDYMGRRWTLIVASLGMIAGWQTIICAFSITWLLTGRAICGYSTGVLSLIGPIYLSEVSPPAVRGSLTSAVQLFVATGLLAMYIVANFCAWKWLALFGMVFASLTVILLLFSVESPAWYFSREQHSKATKSLLFLWGDCDQVTSEIMRQEGLSERQGPIMADSVDHICKISVTKPILLSVLLMVAQQGSAVNAVVFYAEDIFHRAGSSLSAYTCMVAFGLEQVIGAVISMSLIDSYGRRYLLLGSSFLVSISLYTMVVYFIELKSPSGQWGWIPLVAMSIYAIAFAVGLGPVAWVMMGELLPQRCRSYGSILATSVNYTCAFLVTNQWSKIQTVLSAAGTYAVFATITLVLATIFLVELPETKGKSLVEIERYFVRLQRVDATIGASSTESSIVATPPPPLATGGKNEA
ncbi:facilitated trehalose transporter Tret1-like isoform X1 [Varroa jacobsoni]|uniref:facilitated trehalose transporter Tret1-like isoform X1 n=1 Tax=Varroa jacobsoni TaxID=62625 RepID=UPI000BF985E7|nr:facilitated trehalose transporter Tret1-like isoform X1 [Varroa jacobsoni]XP_022701778.1 facilitated trehalose transporter Tret1-like isoform X1 [Varroa jacobsoni]XP_022701779.1 facilitated trehalose transporter Tret1-like isoform X1 [Varroa jacobsoni]